MTRFDDAGVSQRTGNSSYFLPQLMMPELAARAVFATKNDGRIIRLMAQQVLGIVQLAARKKARGRHVAGLYEHFFEGHTKTHIEVVGKRFPESGSFGN